MARIVQLGIRITPGLDRRIRAAVERDNSRLKKNDRRISRAQFVIDALTAWCDACEDEVRGK